MSSRNEGQLGAGGAGLGIQTTHHPQATGQPTPVRMRQEMRSHKPAQLQSTGIWQEETGGLFLGGEAGVRMGKRRNGVSCCEKELVRMGGRKAKGRAHTGRPGAPVFM